MKPLFFSIVIPSDTGREVRSRMRLWRPQAQSTDRPAEPYIDFIRTRLPGSGYGIGRNNKVAGDDIT